MTTREKIEVMEASERGEEIECVTCGYNGWGDAKTLLWNWDKYVYRVKPKQKQVVVIEKWLCKYGFNSSDRLIVIEMCSTNNMEGYTKIKLLDTYEVEL